MHFLRGQKNTAAKPEHGDPEIIKKPLGKQAKRAEGPRYGNNPAAAPPSRAQAILQGNPYKTNRKQAFTLGAACVAPCTTVPRLSKNTVKRNTL